MSELKRAHNTQLATVYKSYTSPHTFNSVLSNKKVWVVLSLAVQKVWGRCPFKTHIFYQPRPLQVM